MDGIVLAFAHVRNRERHELFRPSPAALVSPEQTHAFGVREHAPLRRTEARVPLFSCGIATRQAHAIRAAPSRRLVRHAAPDAKRANALCAAGLDPREPLERTLRPSFVPAPPRLEIVTDKGYR